MDPCDTVRHWARSRVHCRSGICKKRLCYISLAIRLERLPLALGALVDYSSSLQLQKGRVLSSPKYVFGDRHPVVGPLLCERPSLWSNLKIYPVSLPISWCWPNSPLHQLYRTTLHLICPRLSTFHSRTFLQTTWTRTTTTWTYFTLSIPFLTLSSRLFPGHWVWRCLRTC